MSEHVTYTFDLDPQVHSKLKELAEAEHRTLAGQIRLIIDEWLEEKSNG